MNNPNKTVTVVLPSEVGSKPSRPMRLPRGTYFMARAGKQAAPSLYYRHYDGIVELDDMDGDGWGGDLGPEMYDVRPVKVTITAQYP